MILISIMLSGITSIHRYYYILPLNYCKIFCNVVFSRGEGGLGILHLTKYQEGKFLYRVESLKKGFSHEENISKRPPLGEKGSP